MVFSLDAWIDFKGGVGQSNAVTRWGKGPLPEKSSVFAEAPDLLPSCIKPSWTCLSVMLETDTCMDMSRHQTVTSVKLGGGGLASHLVLALAATSWMLSQGRGWHGPVFSWGEGVLASGLWLRIILVCTGDAEWMGDVQGGGDLYLQA